MNMMNNSCYLERRATLSALSMSVSWPTPLANLQQLTPFPQPPSRRFISMGVKSGRSQYTHHCNQTKKDDVPVHIESSWKFLFSLSPSPLPSRRFSIAAFRMRLHVMRVSSAAAFVCWKFMYYTHKAYSLNNAPFHVPNVQEHELIKDSICVGER
jgi:hypothetical protein